MIDNFWQALIEFIELVAQLVTGWPEMPDGERIFVGIIACLYLLPSLVASHRRVTRRHGVYVVSLLMGWTGVFWVLALAWAVAADKEPEPEDYTRWTRSL